MSIRGIGLSGSGYGLLKSPSESVFELPGFKNHGNIQRYQLNCRSVRQEEDVLEDQQTLERSTEFRRWKSTEVRSPNRESI